MARFLKSSSKNNQRGAALIIMAAFLVVGAASFLLTGISQNRILLDRPIKNAAVFSIAKEALIGFALTSDQVAPQIGLLPCPDLTGDGIAAATCGNNNQSLSGWLPWQTLGIAPTRDASGNCLRYAISGNYKMGTTATLQKGPMPPRTPGQFVIHDQNNNAIGGSTFMLALIFAPGKSFSGQNRALTGTATTCGSTLPGAPINLSNNHLESFSNVNNADGTWSPAGAGLPGSLPLPTAVESVFISAPVDITAAFNDSINWISPDDFSAVYNEMP